MSTANSADGSSLVALHWPFDWKGMPSWKKFLLHVPAVGPHARAYRDIARQLRLRSRSCLESWNEFSESERQLARTLSKIATRGLGWPNDYFIPEDPFAIIVWDRYGDLATSEILAEVETETGLPPGGATEWEGMLAKRFGEVVRILSGKRRQGNW